MIVLLGSKGFLGSSFKLYLENKKVQYLCVERPYSVNIHSVIKQVRNSAKKNKNLSVYIINFAFPEHPYPASVSDEILTTAIKIYRATPNSIIIHPNSDFQRVSRNIGILPNDRYLIKKSCDLLYLRQKVDKLISVQIASAVSNISDSNSGLDYFIKKRVSVDSKF